MGAMLLFEPLFTSAAVVALAEVGGNHPRHGAARMRPTARDFLVVVLLALQGCAGGIARLPPDAEPAAAAATIRGRAAEAALAMVGKPYVFGGASPASGFDCSGLVQFAFKQAGWSVPRSTEEQQRRSVRIRFEDLRRGDLLFFDQDGRKNSHVALYVGDGRFVHAPSNAKATRTDVLSSAYWRRHFSEARRIEPSRR